MLGKFFKLLLTLYRWIRSFCLNLIFILVLILVISALFSTDQYEIPQGAALLIAPVGTIVEEKTGISSFSDLFSGAGASDEVLLQDILDSIEIAGRDDAISAIVLRLDDLAGAALSHLQDIGNALTAFKASGKTVYALGDNFSQSQYYLASYADEIILNDIGAVNLEGMSSFQYYYAEALDKLAVNVHVFRVGEYKSAVEPFELTGMSDAARENYTQWLNQSWQIYIDDVGRERGMEPTMVNDLINNIDQRLASVDGDTAVLALDTGLVDQTLARPQMRNYLMERIGADEDGSSFSQVPMDAYLTVRRIALDILPGGNQIGVITANGTIYDGEQAAGAIGGDTLAALIRQAAQDDDIKALVLRVNSPGGSAFASEVIRSELLEFKSTGKPLVISMGSVAASGGYWIATAGDQIWATPGTITGSIGIFGIYPTFRDSLASLGIYVDGVGTTEQAGVFGLGMELPESTASAIQSNVENGYARFLRIVSESRDMTPAEVDAVGQGRVWSAQSALDAGLVDSIGELDDAIAAAAELAGLEQYRTRQVTRPLSPAEILIRDIADSFDIVAKTRTWFGDGTSLISSSPLSSSPLSSSPLPLLYRQIENDLQTLLQLNDPGSLYLQCFTCYNRL